MLLYGGRGEAHVVREDFKEHRSGVGHRTQKLAEAVARRDDACVIRGYGDPSIFMRRIEGCARGRIAWANSFPCYRL
jgi:hypothetical protein